jgi:periplasmic protein TonB
MYDNLRNILDIDELLFETRNKDYGAYQLRKRYNSVVITGIIMSSILTTLAVVIPFILTSQNEHLLSGGGNYIQVHMENLAPPPEEVFVPPAPPPPKTAHIQEIVEYVPPVVVDSLPPLEKQMATTDEFLAQPSNDNAEAKSNGPGDDFLAGNEGSETNAPFLLVEVMPAFKGGDINKFR